MAKLNPGKSACSTSSCRQSHEIIVCYAQLSDTRLTMHTPSRESEREMEYAEFEVTPPDGANDQAALQAFCQRVADALTSQTHFLNIPPISVVSEAGRVSVIVGHMSSDGALVAGNQLAATLRRRSFTVGNHAHATAAPAAGKQAIRTAPAPVVEDKPEETSVPVVQEPKPPAPPTHTAKPSAHAPKATGTRKPTGGDTRPDGLHLEVMPTPPTLRHGPRNEVACQAVFNALKAHGRPLSNKEIREHTGLSVDRAKTAIHYLLSDGHVTAMRERGGSGVPRYFFALSSRAAKAGVYSTDDLLDLGKLWGKGTVGKVAVLKVLVPAAQKVPAKGLTIEEVNSQISAANYKSIWMMFRPAVKAGLLSVQKQIGGYSVNVYTLTAAGLTAGLAYLRKHDGRVSAD